MKTFRKFVSVILAFIMCFTMTASFKTEAAKEPENPLQYAEMLWNEGYVTVSTDTIIAVVRHFGRVLSIFTRENVDTKRFNLRFDSFTSELCSYICSGSGLDLEKIFTNLPDINIPANLAVETFSIDTTAFRNQMYEKRAECDKKGDGASAMLYHFLGVYLSIIELCEVYGEKTENPDVVELKLRFTYKDGSTETVSPGIYVNTVTGQCSNKDDSGMIGIGFNFSLAEMTVYATVNCWMRNFGFCLLYDIAATMMPAIYRYETRRFKFDYDGLQWMIQIWKGNYVVANGSEVGIYYREPQAVGSFYNCADNSKMLPMSMKLYRGDKLLMERAEENHWWINGFTLSGRMYLPLSLKMEFSIAMPDEEMLEAFCSAIDEHYMHDVSYTVDGLKVNVIW